MSKAARPHRISSRNAWSFGSARNRRASVNGRGPDLRHQFCSLSNAHRHLQHTPNVAQHAPSTAGFEGVIART